MANTAIAIPLYLPELTGPEEISLRSIFSVFSDRDIFIVHPEGLALDNFKLFGRFKSLALPKHFFLSIEAYNSLMLSPRFYELFLDYKYILVAQLDSYIFRDELDTFCAASYDYVGAPWFTSVRDGWIKTSGSSNGREMIYAGNGGLSLRKTESFLKVLSIAGKGIKARLMNKDLRNIQLSFPHKQLKRNNIRELIRNYPRNEDIFWGMDVPAVFSWFKTAPVETAARFSFDEDPGFMLSYTKGEFPMGCHGWHNRNYDFWKAYITSDIPK